MKISIESSDIETLTAQLGALPPGKVISVVAYKSGDSPPRDVSLQLVDAGRYRQMQEQSFQVVRACLAEGQAPKLVDVTPEVVTEALLSLSASYAVNLSASKDADATARRGPDYQHVAGSVYKLGEAFYLLRCEVISDAPTPKLPKAEVARVKALLVTELNLPVGRYMHVLKLEPSYFERIVISY